MKSFVTRIGLYFILFVIILVCTIVSTIILIMFFGSRTSGIGYGLWSGLVLGNLVYSLLQKDGRLKNILIWIFSSIMAMVAGYYLLNNLPIDNTLILYLLVYILPLIISREIIKFLVTMIKTNTKKL